MISFFESDLKELSVHRIGNKLQEEYMVLSETPVKIDDDILNGVLLKYFLGPFEKVNEIYRFYQSNENLNLNDVYHFVSEVFNDSLSFHVFSTQLAKHLYDVSSHPKIKTGELYVAQFNNVQIEGELHDAIGIFKSENKETYLKVDSQNNVFQMSYEQEAINIHKLDKGCLIFNTEKMEGYKVAVIDNTNRNQEAVYWKDDFLKLKIRNDNFNQTNNVLGVYKSFVTKKIDDEFEVTKADKIDLLNRSIKYFKEKDSFDLTEFTEEVIGNEQGIASFLNYKKSFEDEFESPIANSFDINDAAVKKQARVYKSVLKLDKNFHIYIHGDKKLIEKGFDKEKSMNYYKVYFKDEE
jgi:hypothetical protein